MLSRWSPPGKEIAGAAFGVAGKVQLPVLVIGDAVGPNPENAANSGGFRLSRFLREGLDCFPEEFQGLGRPNFGN